ncbi:MAG: hypothetical protein MUO40_04560 [Anaerolineaceae bacterium]|nr:hypothetical protein [Anaerolineaceae bacterium]
MTQQAFKVKSEIKSVHIKSYGTLKITGSDTDQVVSSSSGRGTLTVVQSEDVIFVTAMNSCKIALPKSLPVIVEKAMGSVHCNGLESDFSSEKVLGNLVVDGGQKVNIQKIGGSCSLRNIGNEVVIVKVGGSLFAENVTQLQTEKIGGSCKIKNAQGPVSIVKIGGSFSGQGLQDSFSVSKVGGDFVCEQTNFGIFLKVGGDITTKMVGELAPTELKAGGDIKLFVDSELTDFDYEFSVGEEGKIVVNIGEFSMKEEDGTFIGKVGSGGPLWVVAAGGDISISDNEWKPDFIDEDLSKHFENTEMGFNEMIHQHVDRVTEMAEKRIEAAQKRLERYQNKIDINLSEMDIPPIPPIPPMPFYSSPSSSSRKGTSDEERLLILQMLQEKKISVEEAEKLFRTLEK